MTNTGDSYLLSRGVGPSIRLLAQHCLWKDQFGWNLHPAAKEKWAADQEKDGKEIPRSIADVATGNAIWLIEEANGLPPGSKAMGFDISQSMAPASHTLPDNVSLHTLNAAAEIPAEFIEAFDVVHVRLVIAAVRGNDPTPVLRNMIRMLKPGGMLQCGEVMSDGHILGQPQKDGQAASMKAWAEVSKKLGISQIAPEEVWLRKLPTIFEEHGLHRVQCTKAGEPRRDMWKYWAEMVLGALEEIVAATGVAREFLPAIADERDKGDYLYVEPRIVTGWKAE